MNDKIAVVIKQFSLLKNADGIFQKYNEPYIVSIAIDEQGVHNNILDFNVLPFPNVRKGDTIDFDGQGHLVYGPKNPGEFLCYSILFMESDKDIRAFGSTLESIIKTEAISTGIKETLKSAPTYGTAISVLTQLTSIISERMQENKDDELFRRNGTLLRDVKPPYDILRTYTGSNNFIESKVSIIPLSHSNNLGISSTQILL